MTALKIGKTRLDEGLPYLIAEAGVNHNGDEAIAHRLVEIAASSRADAVKFQLFEPTTLVRRETPSAEYQRKVSSNQFDMLRRLELPRPAFKELAEHAREGFEWRPHIHATPAIPGRYRPAGTALDRNGVNGRGRKSAG